MHPLQHQTGELNDTAPSKANLLDAVKTATKTLLNQQELLAINKSLRPEFIHINT